MERSKRIISSVLSLAIAISVVSSGFTAKASFFDEVLEKIDDWERIEGAVDFPALSVGNALAGVTLSGGRAEAGIERDYYTTPSSSTEDKYGNVTNYYRGGDTTTTKILDSYNHTFNTIHNTTNNTNNYSANVKLSDFLNSYTTNTSNYTYNTKYNSWYYDQSSQSYTYDASQTYYNTDNSKYYISIDNSTDEYYLVDIQYSPTFVTVNYEYNNIDNSVTNNYGDVTNVYYFELSDGRNSSSLTASEVAGLDLGYDVVNYESIIDDPNTLFLQHFDGNYLDSSSYGRQPYVVNPSTQYVDSGEFGKAVKLQNGYLNGVQIPGLSSLNSFMIDFRVYYSDISSLSIYFGDENIFSPIPNPRTWVVKDIKPFDDYSSTLKVYYTLEEAASPPITLYKDYTIEEFVTLTSSSLVSPDDPWSIGSHPVSFDSPGYSGGNTGNYGIYDLPNAPTLVSSSTEEDYAVFTSRVSDGYYDLFEKYQYTYSYELHRNRSFTYKAEPLNVVAFDFPYASYANQWLPIRLVYSNGTLSFYCNGGFVNSCEYSVSELDVFFIKALGNLYLDELRISTGDMVSAEVYTPSSEPFDTNMVLALPDVLSANTIYVRHSTPVTAWRIGGVRPSNPTTGFFYIPLHSDYTAAQAQLYDGSNWVDVDAVVSDGSTTTNTLGFTFNPVSQSPDVDMDAKPGGSGSGDALNCDHVWKCNSRVESTCTVTGQASYACTKCSQTKIETLPLTSHSWTVKQTVPTSYDESGNILTEGYTIYRCGICGEEYKDSDGSGPPMVDSSVGSGSSSGDSGWFGELMQKIGDFFGTTVGGLLELIGTAISKLLDSLISLVTMAVEKLTEVLNLFGSFGEALGVLWSWLPEDVVLVLVAGVTVIIFAAVIKLFVR